MVTYGGLQR